ncbi:MAG TPA: putative leader peptide [Geodermatophilus sp.]|nr:putative leader peptide [Geodermatophilus sp.]
MTDAGLTWVRRHVDLCRTATALCPPPVSTRVSG